MAAEKITMPTTMGLSRRKIEVIMSRPISWGSIMGKNRNYTLTAWWTVAFPGIAIVITGLSIALIGDGLQDAFNPKLRGR